MAGTWIDDALRRDRIDRDKKAVLAAGPWTWPPALDQQERLLTLLSASSIPGARPGQALLVTVNERRPVASLWVADALPPQTESGHRLVGQARQAWDTAATALLRLLPARRRPIRALIRKHPQPRHLASLPLRDGVIREPSNEVDGLSVGLSFFLAQASIVLDVPGTALPADFAASAAIDSDGALSRVEGLSDKLRAIAWGAPGVRRVFVAEAQREEAEAALKEWGLRYLEIVGVRHATEAFEQVFGRLPERLAQAGVSGDRRQEFISDLLRLAMRGGDADGPPLEAAERVARAALERRDLESDEQARLEFVVRTITAHEAPWLERLPAPFREALSHYFRADEAPDIDWNRRVGQAAMASTMLVRLVGVLALAELQALGRLRAPKDHLRRALLAVFSVREDGTGASHAWRDVLQAAAMVLENAVAVLAHKVVWFALELSDVDATLASADHSSRSPADAQREVRRFESLCVGETSRFLADLETPDLFPWMLGDSSADAPEVPASAIHPGMCIFRRLERGGSVPVAHYARLSALTGPTTSQTGEAAATLERWLANWEIREQASRFRFDEVVGEHRELFVGRAQALDEAITWIARQTGGVGLILGPSGSGKTAFAANLIAKIESRYAPVDGERPGWLCVRHFADTSAEFVKSVSMQLQAEGGPRIDFSPDRLEQRRRFLKAVKQFAADALGADRRFDRLVLVVDGLDHLVERDTYFVDLLHGFAEAPVGNVVWICLGRQTQRVLAQLSDLPSVFRAPGLVPLSRDAISEYLRGALSTECERWEPVWQEMLDVLVSADRHLPKYLESFVRDLKNDRYDPARPEAFKSLPQDLHDQIHKQCESLVEESPALDAMVLIALSRMPLTQTMLESMLTGADGDVESALATLARETVWTRTEEAESADGEVRLRPQHAAVSHFFLEGVERADFHWRPAVTLALRRLVAFCARWHEPKRTAYERSYALATSRYHVESLRSIEPELSLNLSPFLSAEFADAVATERPRLEALDGLKWWTGVFVGTQGLTNASWLALVAVARTHASLATRMDETDWSALVADADLTRLRMAIDTEPDRNRRSILTIAVAALLRESGNAAAARSLDSPKALPGKQQQFHRNFDDVTQLYLDALLRAEAMPEAFAVSHGPLPDPLSVMAVPHLLYQSHDYGDLYRLNRHVAALEELDRAVAAAARASDAHERQAGAESATWRVRSSISWWLLAIARRPIRLAAAVGLASWAVFSAVLDSPGMAALVVTWVVAVMCGYATRRVIRSAWFRSRILREARSLASLGLRQEGNASLRTYSVLCARLGRVKLRSDEQTACTPFIVALAKRQLLSPVPPDSTADVIVSAIRVTDDFADYALIQVLRELKPAHLASTLDALLKTAHVDRRETRIALGVIDLLEANRQFLPALLRRRSGMTTDEEKDQIGKHLAAKPASYLAWTLIDDLRPPRTTESSVFRTVGAVFLYVFLAAFLYSLLAVALEDPWRPLWVAGVVVTLMLGARRWDRHDLTTVRLNGDLNTAAGRLIDHLRQKEINKEINLSRPSRDARPIVDTLTAQRLLSTRLDDAEFEPTVLRRVLRRLDVDSAVDLMPPRILLRVMGHPELVEAVSMLRWRSDRAVDFAAPTEAEQWQQLRRTLPVANPLVSLLLVAGSAVGLVLLAATMQWLAFPADRGDTLMAASVAAWLQIAIAVSAVQHGLPAVNRLLSRVGKRFPSWLYAGVAALVSLALVRNPLSALPGVVLGEPSVLPPREAVVLVLGFAPFALVQVIVPYIIASARGTNLLYPTSIRRQGARLLAVAVAGATALTLALLGHLVITLAR